MNLLLFCLLLISNPFPLISHEVNFDSYFSDNAAVKSKSEDYALNLKSKLYSYETVNELIHDYDAPDEVQLMNVTHASVPQNAPIANSLWLPLLSMLAGLLLWRFHVQSLLKKQARVNQNKD